MFLKQYYHYSFRDVDNLSSKSQFVIFSTPAILSLRKEVHTVVSISFREVLSNSRFHQIKTPEYLKCFHQVHARVIKRNQSLLIHGFTSRVHYCFLSLDNSRRDPRRELDRADSKRQLVLACSSLYRKELLLALCEMSRLY